MTRLAAAVVAVLSLVAGAGAQQPTFSSRRESVRIDALVTDRGRPVTGLSAGDFDVLDSGVAQQVDFVSFEQVPVSVVLALDGSASMSGERLTHLQQAGRGILSRLKPDDRAALVTFSDAVILRQGLTTNAAPVALALDRLTPSQRRFAGTALIDAAYSAMSLLDDDTGRGLTLVFSDGVDTSSWLAPERAVEFARRANVVVYGVTTSRLRGDTFLRQLAETTGGSAIEVKSTDAVAATFATILDEFRQRYLVTFSPANVPAGGWHPLTVRVKNRRAEVKARPGYSR